MFYSFFDSLIFDIFKAILNFSFYGNLMK